MKRKTQPRQRRGADRRPRGRSPAWRRRLALGRTVGVQAPLAARLIETRGKATLPALVKAIEAAGGPFGLDEAARIAVVKGLDTAEP